MSARRLPGLTCLLLLACAAAPAVHGAELGRLFLSVPERNELERVRQGGRPAVRPAPVVEAVPGADAVAPLPPPARRIMFDGVVTRSDSPRSTAWVDAVARPGNGLLAGGTALALRLPSGRAVRLKPGQSVDTASGKVREGHATGTLSIRRTR